MRLAPAFVLAALGANALPALAADEAAPRVALTVYSASGENGASLFAAPENGQTGGYAIVRDRRQFDLKAGRNVVVVRDVSRYIDPSALSARALGDGGAEILSQRFDDDTLSLDALVQRHLGHSVDIAAGSAAAPASVSGTLLSNAGGLTVQSLDGRITTVTEFNRITFPDLPKGLAATPSMRWTVEAKKPGTQLFEIVYPTQGLAWRAEYSGWLGGGDCRLALSGWAQIANRSGTDFPDAKIKLVAGEPHHVEQATAPRMLGRAAVSSALQAGDIGMVGDYHEYALDRPVDLANGTLTRAALFPDAALACRREYLFEGSHVRANPGMAPITERAYGSEASAPVRSTLSFKADRALPAGRLRILQGGGEDAPDFIGEDMLAHTPRGETVNIELGNAFDLRGERRQTDFQVDKEHRTLSESFAIRLTNGGGSAQTALVREHLYRWTQWNIAQSSAKYTRHNADTIDFAVDVPANGTATVTYTVQYQWSESLK